MGELVKHASDKDRYLEDTLTPGFFRMYELDALLPMDWQMELRIMSHGTMGDSLIGKVHIDLEDRLMGEPLLKERLSYMVYKHQYSEELKELQYKYSKEEEDRKRRISSEVGDL